MNDFNLRGDGRTVLITGAASGIGRALAEAFGQAGYRLLLADLDRERGAAFADELTSAGREVEMVAADVTDEAQVAELVRRGVERWEKIDVAINNAGIVGRGGRIDDLDADDLEQVLAVNLKGAFYVAKHVVPGMRGDGGVILAVTSITARLGTAYFAPYAAAKAGLVAMMQGLARNLGRSQIRFNCLELGSIAGTELMAEHRLEDPLARRKEELGMRRQIPMGRPGRPRDVAHLALCLASPLASHIHGAVLTLDGGEALGFH